MRSLMVLMLTMPLLACEPQRPATHAPPKAPGETAKSGITISGSARVGVSARF